MTKGKRNHGMWVKTKLVLALVMFVFVILKVNALAASEALRGDVNGDGVVNRADRIHLSRALAEWDGYELIEETADINLDGSINRGDRIYLTRALAGWDGYVWTELLEQNSGLVFINDGNGLYTEYTPMTAEGGVLIVTDGAHYGALDYQGNEIVPCEYDNYNRPTEAGYFIMHKGTANGDYSEDAFLFSKSGELITEIKGGAIRAANDAYYFKKGSHLEYRKYDGTLIYQSDIASSATRMLDGKAIVMTDDGDWNWKYYSVSVDGTVQQINPAGCYIVSPKNHGAYLMRDAAEGEFYLNDDSNGKRVNVNLGLSYVDENGNCTCQIYNYDGYYGVTSHISGSFDAEYLSTSSFNGEAETELMGYYKEGGFVYHYGSKVIVRCKEKYVLVNALETNPKPNFPVFDYLKMSDEKYWLAHQGDKWGYADHDGIVQVMYEDAAEYYHGKAFVIQDGAVCLIDEGFNCLAKMGKGTRVASTGDLFIYEDLEGKTHYYICQGE